METRKPGSKGSSLLRIALVVLVAVFGVGLVTAAGVYWKLSSLSQDAVAIVTRPSTATGVSNPANPSNPSNPSSQPGMTTAPGTSGGSVSSDQASQPGQAVATSPGSTQQLPAQTTAPAAPNPQQPTPTPLPIIEGTPPDIDIDYDVPVDDPRKDPIYEAKPADRNVINIVLLSSDARPGEKVGRSDSIMILSYNRKSATLRMVSVMRDTWVPIEGHDWNRINAAFSYGGIGLSVNTLNDNFGLDIQNYATVRFEQFISVVDQMGGVPVSLSTAEIVYINNAYSGKSLDTSPGYKLLNGAQTLIHCRNRKVGNGDFDRTRRQRSTMLAILYKMRQQRNPVTLTRLVNYALGQINTNMKASEILSLSLEALNADNLTFREARIPFDNTWHYANENGRSVIAIDIAANRERLHAFLYPK